MARKKCIDLDADTTISFGDKEGDIGPGQEAAGYYIGSKTVKTKFGPAKLHVLQTPEGNLGVWGCFQLDQKLATVPPGCMAFISYLKKVTVPSGSMKTFSVEYDDEDKIHVDVAQINFRDNDASAEEDYSEGEADEADESEEAEEEADEPAAKPLVKTKPVGGKPAAAAPKAAAAAMSPAAKAKVNALLGKKN